MNNNGKLDDDTLIIIVLGVVVCVVAPTILGTMFAPVQQWLVAVHVLTTHNVLIPIGVDAGLDILRISILAGALIIAAGLAVLAIRQRINRALLQRQEARR